jgi:probable addiction module antidote protein
MLYWQFETEWWRRSAHLPRSSSNWQGMTEIAKASGLTREALYKALRSDSQPRLDTIQRVCTALGVKLSVVPA